MKFGIFNYAGSKRTVLVDKNTDLHISGMEVRKFPEDGSTGDIVKFKNYRKDRIEGGEDNIEYFFVQYPENYVDNDDILAILEAKGIESKEFEAKALEEFVLSKVENSIVERKRFNLSKTKYRGWLKQTSELLK